MTSYGLDYLRDSGYEKEEYLDDAFGHGGPEESITEFAKIFDEHYIVIRIHENEWGGKTIIEVGLNYSTEDNLPLSSESYKRMRAPTVKFFASGYGDYAAMEKKVVEEIVPKLKQWAIET